MDNEFVRGETPTSLYARLTSELREPATAAELVAQLKRLAPKLSARAAEILCGSGSNDEEFAVAPLRKQIEARRDLLQWPELGPLRAASTPPMPVRKGTLAKRASDPDELVPQAPDAVRAVADGHGGVREYDVNGSLVAMYKAGTALPAAA